MMPPPPTRRSPFSPECGAGKTRLIGELASRAREAGSLVLSGDSVELGEGEQQVLALLARGATNREVGVELHMAEKTACVHVSRILAKLDVRSGTEAAALAHRQRLIGFAV
jgi:DNA-binding NarL/FixJ family response regulator